MNGVWFGILLSQERQVTITEDNASYNELQLT